MLVIRILRNRDLKNQLGRLSVHRIIFSPLFEDHCSKARSFDRLGFSVRNGDPVSNAGRSFLFTLFNRFFVLFLIGKIVGFGHQIRDLVDGLLFGPGFSVEVYPFGADQIRNSHPCSISC